MQTCTHPGTGREVYEPTRPHTCSTPFEERKMKKQNKQNIAAPKAHHKIHSNPATTTTSRRRAILACFHRSGFVEIGLVQLAQSVKTTNVTHTQTQADRQTDKLNNGTLYAPRCEKAFLP